MGTPPSGVRVICFSATASFTSGIALIAIGAVTMLRTREPQEVPLAAIPGIFGVQQLVEGCLWLGLPGQPPTSDRLAMTYLLFSHVLWPFFVPLAIWLIEPSARHRRRIAWGMAAGAATSMFFLVILLSEPVSATIEGLHIRYHLPHPHENIAFAFYAAATCLSPLLSSLKTARMLGVLIAASMVASYLIYAMWFASVWCFFAALVSSVVFLHFSGRRTRRQVA
ncbi:hypothetical protein OLX02_08935 [Novosphingobium sp. KCTC 2891]|nr:hypothetical protein [Novosphingobium sp. KCTC 2891]